jgi:hypothetical protein
MFVGAPARRGEFLPANPEANAIGILKGEYQTVGPGAGWLRAMMPDGEVLTGQYAIVQAGASGFGSIYASAFTPLAMPGVVYGRSRTAQRSSPCLASLVGDHGTWRVLQRQRFPSRFWRLQRASWRALPVGILALVGHGPDPGPPMTLGKDPASAVARSAAYH